MIHKIMSLLLRTPCAKEDDYEFVIEFPTAMYKLSALRVCMRACAWIGVMCIKNKFQKDCTNVCDQYRSNPHGDRHDKRILALQTTSFQEKDTISYQLF